jgi:hypothetical protein
MRPIWNGIARADWDALHRSAAGPLQQDWAWGDALAAAGVPVLRGRLDREDGAPLALAQFIARRVAGLLSVGLCSRGPLFVAGASAAGPAGGAGLEAAGVGPDVAGVAEPSAAQLAAACRAFTRSMPLGRPRLLFSAPETAAPLPGLHRVVTGQSVVLVDLGQSPETLRAAMHPKWRNRLVAAERVGLRVQRTGTREAQYRWLLEREAAQRGRRGYWALPSGFVEAWQRAAAAGEPEPLLTLRVDQGREPIAGMMFLVRGTSALYHVGWADERGRDAGAHPLLLWQAMLMLRERGVRRLELGAVDTQRGATLARFKIGSGGRVAGFSGTWL